MVIKKTISLLGISLLLTCISITFVHAQSASANAPTFVPLADFHQAPVFSAALGSTSLADYINNVFKIVLSVGGILAVLRIAYAGYMYMGSADMWGNKQHAKEMLGDAIIGLLLLFGIYLILNQINPHLLNLDILKNVNHSGSSNSVTNTSIPANQPAGEFNANGGPSNGGPCTTNGKSGTMVSAICQVGI